MTKCLWCGSLEALLGTQRVLRARSGEGLGPHTVLVSACKRPGLARPARAKRFASHSLRFASRKYESGWADA